MEEPPRKRRNREHTNSRNGCVQCKARKVKCDEEKPRCRACNRRSTPCTYSNEGLDQLASAASVASFERQDHGFSFTPIQSDFGETSHEDVGKPPPPPSLPPPPESAVNFTSVQQEYRNITPRIGGAPTNGTPSRSSHSLAPLSAPKSSPSTLNLDHLELFHHFTAVTSSALTVGTFDHDVWQTTIPKIAVSHDWLMHGLLAVSALHIAHLKPEQRGAYWKRAAMHQDQALQGHQKALANLNRENGDALFAFTILIIHLACASLDRFKGAEDAPMQGIVRCLHMLRGDRAIAPSVKQSVEVGPLANMLQHQPGSIKISPTFRDPSTDAHFSKLLVFASTHGDINQDSEMSDTEVCAAAASSLRACFLKVEAIPEGEANTLPIWHWAARLPASFVTRLGEFHVVPQILLAHWCVLVAQVQHYWWIQGWVDEALRDVGRCLSQDYREWLDWPNDRIQETRNRKAEDER